MLNYNLFYVAYTYIYIYIYFLDWYINELICLIKNDENLEIIEENFVEWEINDWNKLENNSFHCSPQFNIADKEWLIFIL